MWGFNGKKIFYVEYQYYGLNYCTYVKAKDIAEATKKIQKKHSGFTVSITDWKVVS